MPHELKFRVGPRSISFNMCYDPASSSDVAAFTYFKNGQVPEPEVVNAFVQILRPRDLVVDVGANVGFFSLLASFLVGSYGAVVAVEPGQNNWEAFKANMDANPSLASAVVLEPCAAWSSDEKGVFYLGLDGGLNSIRSFDEATTATVVELKRLDSLIMETPRLIKIDAEGSELEILNGMVAFESRVPFIICELNSVSLERFKVTREDVCKFARRQGYELFLLNDLGIFPAYIPFGHPLNVNRQNFNVLFSTMERVCEAWPEVRA